MKINQKGQVVVLLLLVMVIALAIGLSTINRSTLEVSTSRKSEDSSRAFSAAEAGIEKAIQANLSTLGGAPITITPFSLGNQTSANVTVSTGGLPDNTINALAYPPFGKESFAQFWLVSPNYTGTPSSFYTASSYDIYFGTTDPDGKKYDPLRGGNADEKPAIEVTTISHSGGKYVSSSKYFDSKSPARSGFSGCTASSLTPIQVNNGENENFYCKATVTDYSSFPVMVRVRILYSNLSHPVAIKGTGGTGGIIPKQANIYLSSGTSGSVKRTLEVFNEKAVMPQFFDYVLFSASDLQK